jgi:hypothetical protein
MSETSDVPNPPSDTSSTSDSGSHDLSAEGISAIQGGKVSTENQALEQASTAADEEVSEHTHTRAGEQVEYYKLRGRMGEDLAVQNMPEAANMNDLTGKANAPTFDAGSPYEMASVKTKGVDKNGNIQFSNYNQYFEQVVNPESAGNLAAADEYLRIRGEDPARWEALSTHLPPEVAAAGTREQMATALSEYGTLRISGDQVPQVRENLKGRMVRNPEKYGINPALSEAEIAAEAHQLARDRVRPIDKNINVMDIGISARGIQHERRRRGV